MSDDEQRPGASAAAPGPARRLRTFDAVVIGLGSMFGAGVFAAFAPAAAAAGAGLPIGLGLAAVVAYRNATSSAQIAAVYPRSGGTYVYGRERLGDWWGFVAGWGFVVGKTASCGVSVPATAGPGSRLAPPGGMVGCLRAHGSHGLGPRSPYPPGV